MTLLTTLSISLFLPGNENIDAQKQIGLNDYILDSEHKMYGEKFPISLKYNDTSVKFDTTSPVFKKSYYLVVFWSDGCSYCYDLFDYIDFFYKDYSHKVNIISVDLSFNKNIDDNKLLYSWLTDEYKVINSNKDNIHSFQDKYELTAIPMIWIVRNGVIYERFSGFNEDVVSDLIHEY